MRSDIIIESRWSLVTFSGEHKTISLKHSPNQTDDRTQQPGQSASFIVDSGHYLGATVRAGGLNGAFPKVLHQGGRHNRLSDHNSRVLGVAWLTWKKEVKKGVIKEKLLRSFCHMIKP